MASIKHFCAPSYSSEAIEAWVRSKSIRAYQDLPAHHTIIVAEQNGEVIGFGLLNANKKSIDSLYMAPQHSGKGYGKALLNTIEQMAREQGIDELVLSSTLNATAFYRHMGYVGDTKDTHQLLSRIKLDCVIMSKKLTTPLE